MQLVRSRRIGRDALILSGVTAVVLSLAGCLASTAGGVATSMVGALFDDSPPEIEFTIQADANVNLTTSGESTSIVLRIYELKTDGVFEAASFADLYERDDELLAADLIKKEQISLVPEETLEIERELDMKTTHIGIVAGFRNWEVAEWRAVIATPINTTTEARINLIGNRLSVELD